MEKLRPTRSKVSSFSDRRSYSGERFAAKERASFRGNRQAQKQKTVGSDSSSCSSGSTGEDPLTFEFGWRSSKQGVGAPMKKLLADEMLRETESRRRSPSVIAKLMGLDGMPPQQPISHKPQKVIPENRHQRTRSVEKEHRSGVSYDHRSSMKNSKEKQEFKDVFEVLETSKVENRSYSSRGAANTKLSDAEMAFVRQKFMDAKRLSTDEKLQDSKEFNDALEVLDSNKDLLLKFLQQPDSLFTKHLHDLHRGSQSHCGRVASMKSSEAQKFEKIDLGWTSARETSIRNHTPQRHRDSFSSYSDSRHATRYSLKSSQYRPEAKHETAITPTRIVVLKPNLGKVLNAAKTISSPCSSQASMSVCRNHSEFSSIGNRVVDTRGKNNFRDNEGQSGHKSRESREVAKEITRQMRNNLSMGSMQFLSSGFRGYAGDESSFSMSENESGNESEVMSVASKQSCDIHNHSRRSSTCYTESSVSREAKKRLSERWRMTHKSQEVGVPGRGSTLAEMLAIPDKEMQAAKREAMKGEAGFRDKYSTEDGPLRWGGPLGISSRDGWKDECINSLSRSKSLPSSSNAFGSSKSSMRRESIRDDRYLIPAEAFTHRRYHSVEVDFDHREGACRNYRCRNKRSYSSHSLSRESIEISPVTPNTPDSVRTDPEENKQSQQNIAVVESSSGNGIGHSQDSVKLVSVGVCMSFETLDTYPPELSARMSVEANSCSSHQDGLIAEEPLTRSSDEKSVPAKHSVPGIESVGSSKEADQPSPVSVLEVPFNDDVSSSSDCFETLSADLQGLRMQLQLLKLETDSYAEGSMVFSSDEDAGEGSNWFQEAICREEEGWQSSYMVDMFAGSGLNFADHETLETWHTPECPVSPLLFEELEKKYGDEACPKSERKLLFDRINSGLLEMFQQFSDPHPWVQPMKITVGPKWTNKTALEDGLHRILAREENAGEESLDKLLESDSLWLHFGDYIDIIGREVERSMLDELVAEVVVMWCKSEP